MSGHPVNGVVGYFGKVASHGDFVSRRLPVDFVSQWDLWLQTGLQYSRELLCERWLETYLNSPIWHFSLGAEVCGRAAMAGVLMPSVDRVGRYFPLTLAASLHQYEEAQGQQSAWFETLENLALGSLSPGFALATLDSALAALEQELLLPAPAAPGQALFWSGASSLSPPALLACGQLPSAAQFHTMLSGE